MRNILLNFTDQSPFLCKALYTHKVLVRRFMDEFNMDKYSMESVKKAVPRAYVKVIILIITHLFDLFSPSVYRYLPD